MIQELEAGIVAYWAKWFAIFNHFLMVLVAVHVFTFLPLQRQLLLITIVLLPLLQMWGYSRFWWKISGQEGLRVILGMLEILFLVASPLSGNSIQSNPAYRMRNIWTWLERWGEPLVALGIATLVFLVVSLYTDRSYVLVQVRKAFTPPADSS